MDSADNRKYARVTARNLVKCEKFLLKECDWAPKTTNVTKNISAEGLLFETDQAYQLGDVVRLELNLPGWTKHVQELGFGSELPKADLQQLVGTVVRVELLSGSRYDVGVCFAEMAKNDRWALMSYIYDNVGGTDK